MDDLTSLRDNIENLDKIHLKNIILITLKIPMVFLLT